MYNTNSRRLIKVKEHGRNIKIERICPNETCKSLGIEEESKFLLDLDEFGFIKTNNPTEKTNCNIIIIGDSFVENLFTPPRK